MSMRNTVVFTGAVLTAALLASSTAMAQVDASSPRITWDLATTHSQLSAGLPDGESVNLRANIALPGGDSLLAEILDERKFGERGGVVALAYTGNISPSWYATGTVVAGHGGPNWANAKIDAQISRKWLSEQQLVTSIAGFRAEYDGNRSDEGLRLSAALYLPVAAVLEAGITLNVSQPGRVDSHMPYASLTLGKEGQQYFVLRASSGTEAYQAIGSTAQLVNFHSQSLGTTWRYWLGPRWGVTAQAEHYRNPTYQRNTLGVGLFAQW